jgi:hypothetical protein
LVFQTILRGIPPLLARAVFVCPVVLAAGATLGPGTAGANTPPHCANRTESVFSGVRTLLVDGSRSLRAQGICNDPDPADADRLTILLVQGPAHGTLSALPGGPGTNATAYYTSSPGFVGADSIQFRASDPQGASSNVATSTIQVAGPTPQPGQTARGSVVSGKVLVRVPGSASFEQLDGSAPIRVGSVLDLNRGRIRLATAAGTAGGRTQSADFSDGMAVFTQDRRSGLTTLTLTRGDFSSCPGGRQAGWNPFAVAARVGNRVRASGRGRFRTRGRYSAATVRGTTWSVEDTCAGTLTRVTAGSVDVRDFVKRRTVIVRAGGRYLAKRR